MRLVSARRSRVERLVLPEDERDTSDMDGDIDFVRVVRSVERQLRDRELGQFFRDKGETYLLIDIEERGHGVECGVRNGSTLKSPKEVLRHK